MKDETPKFYTEAHFRVYDKDTGEYVSIAPDADGLDLVEICNCDDKDAIQQRIVMTPELAVHVTKMLKKFLRTQHSISSLTFDCDD